MRKNSQPRRRPGGGGPHPLQTADGDKAHQPLAVSGFRCSAKNFSIAV
jgi:hypothetical protein